MVVEDGVEETATRNRSWSAWVMVVVAFGVGLALGTLIALPTESPVTVETTQPVSTAASRPQPAAGIASVVSDFPDALVGVGGGVGSGLEVWHWPSDSALVTRGITDGLDVSFDATGQFIAVTEPVPDLSGVLLSMGRFGSIRAVRSGVTSFAWHDSRSGEMAFTTEERGSWQLYRASRTLVAQLVLEDRFQGGSVVAWGEWGYAIQAGEDQVALVNRDGELRDLEAGRAFASHETGWVFMTDDDLKLVSAGGGVRRLKPVDDELNPISAAAFSPDATRIAMTGRFGVVVLSVDDNELTALSPRFPGGWVAWSSDSRFVIAPAQTGVYIHDLESGDSFNVLAGRGVQAASAFPAGVS